MQRRKVWISMILDDFLKKKLKKFRILFEKPKFPICMQMSKVSIFGILMHSKFGHFIGKDCPFSFSSAKFERNTQILLTPISSKNDRKLNSNRNFSFLCCAVLCLSAHICKTSFDLWIIIFSYCARFCTERIAKTTDFKWRLTKMYVRIYFSQ